MYLKAYHSLKLFTDVIFLCNVITKPQAVHPRKSDTRHHENYCNCAKNDQWRACVSVCVCVCIPPAHCFVVAELRTLNTSRICIAGDENNNINTTSVRHIIRQTEGGQWANLYTWNCGHNTWPPLLTCAFPYGQWDSSLVTLFSPPIIEDVITDARKHSRLCNT